MCNLCYLSLGSHLGFDFPGTWLHVDMAAPAHVVRKKHCSVWQKLKGVPVKFRISAPGLIFFKGPFSGAYF